MEYNTRVLTEEPSNHLKNNGSTDYLIEINHLLSNKSNQNMLITQAIEDIQQSNQILSDKTIVLNEIKDKKKNLIIQINLETHLRNRVVEKIIKTYENLKTVKSSSILIENSITHCINEQRQFTQAKQKLSNLNNEQTQENDNPIEMIEKEVKFNKELEKESANVNNEIDMKSHAIDSLKQKINALKFNNTLTEHKNNIAISEITILLSKCNIVDLNWNALQENIKNADNNAQIDDKINTLNKSCDQNTLCIVELEITKDKLQKEISTENEFIETMTMNISKLNKKISNFKEKLLSSKTETNRLQEKFESDTEILKQEHILKLKNKIESAKYENSKLDKSSVILIDELNEKINNQKENEIKYENEIINLKCLIKEASPNTNIKKEVQLIENKIIELKKKYEIELNKYNLINETAEKHTNSEIDKLNETKHLLETEIQQVKTRIIEEKQHLEQRNIQFKRENEIKFANFEEQTKIYAKEIKRVNEMNEEKRNEKLNKLKEVDSKTKLQLFDLKTKKFNASKELEMRIEDMNEIQEEKEIEIKNQKRNLEYSSSDCESSSDEIQDKKEWENENQKIKLRNLEYSSSDSTSRSNKILVKEEREDGNQKNENKKRTLKYSSSNSESSSDEIQDKKEWENENQKNEIKLKNLEYSSSDGTSSSSEILDKEEREDGNQKNENKKRTLKYSSSDNESNSEHYVVAPKKMKKLKRKRRTPTRSPNYLKFTVTPF